MKATFFETEKIIECMVVLTEMMERQMKDEQGFIFKYEKVNMLREAHNQLMLIMRNVKHIK